MVLTATALFLSIVGIAAFPCWRYSARWGYATSAVAGILLFFVSLLIVGGKAVTSEALAQRLAPPQREVALVETSIIERVSAERSTQPATTIAGPPIPLRRN